jgi:hypothetical protein
LSRFEFSVFGFDVGVDFRSASQKPDHITRPNLTAMETLDQQCEAAAASEVKVTFTVEELLDRSMANIERSRLKMAELLEREERSSRGFFAFLRR